VTWGTKYKDSLTSVTSAYIERKVTSILRDKYKTGCVSNMKFLVKTQSCQAAGNLASLNRSWQSKEGTYCVLDVAGFEPTPPESECDWTRFALITQLRGLIASKSIVTFYSESTPI
jgi:hypothetical protein